MDNPATRATGQLGEYAATPTRPARSTGDIVSDIVANAQEIIRSEVRLARVELKAEAAKLIQAATMFAAGGVFGLFGLGFLLWAVTFGLATAMALWAASLITGVALVAIAGVLIMVGRGRWAQIHKPERTVEELKENVRWLKRPTKS
jgi:uncharacterized membrane protein YqjE